MLTILMALNLVGPLPEDYPKEHYIIYIDPSSKNYDVSRRSQMVHNELVKIDSMNVHKWLNEERAWLKLHFDFKIVDVMSLDSIPQAKRFPCIKWQKNSYFSYFPVDTFAADGIFTLTMYHTLKVKHPVLSYYVQIRKQRVSFLQQEIMKSKANPFEVEFER